MARGAGKHAIATSSEPVDGPWELPDGWRWERLGDVADVNPKTDFATLAPETPITFLPMAAVSEETGVVDTSRRRAASEVSKGFTRFQPGDVIFAKITPCMENGKIAVVPDCPHGVAAGSTEFHVLRARDYEPRLLRYFLVQRLFRQDAERNMSGSAGQRRVPTDFLRESLVPVPPGALQTALVARMEALFAEIDEGDAALADARDGVETYRKALLRAAVMGELTAEWREAHPPDESGNAMLHRILRERRTRWDVEKRRKQARYVEPSAPDARELSGLPEGWCWSSVETVGDVQLGRQRAPQHHAGDDMRPYLRVANVLEGRLDLTDVKSMNFTPSEYETFALRPGDILLNEGQSPELLGRPAIYRGEIEGCCFQKTLLRFRAWGPVSPDFALIVFRHYMHSGRFRRESRITTNMGHLTQVRFVPMEFPVPPGDEQAKIVELVHAGELAADELTIDGAPAGDLRQSILAAAFRGEMVA